MSAPRRHQPAARPRRRSTRPRSTGSSTRHGVPDGRGRRARSSGAARPTRCSCGTGSYGLPRPAPFTRLQGTDLWYLTLELPAGSRIEYKIEVRRGGAGRVIEDPLNPRRRATPSAPTRSARRRLRGAGAGPAADPEARAGTCRGSRRERGAAARRSTSHVYLPARFRRTRRYPLLVVHDGTDYLEVRAMKTVLDNLIHRLDIDHGRGGFSTPRERLREYADYEPHARFIADELVPLLGDRLRSATTGGPVPHGASFGAVASLSTAVPLPRVLRPLLLQSGSLRLHGHRHRARRGPALRPGREVRQPLPRRSRRRQSSGSSSAAASTSR